ncbi:unnamed protein product [Clonostachys byssicola]|uniref:Spray n=1 Tax=Clonostachys byssicola TaxID=160290 RepID=A0A9N9UUP3_9HYPO|nr:unnamed protein product [Clonostachys byssicola]
MAYLNSVSKEPMRDDPNHHLTHRASNISALSDFDSNPYDAPAHTLIPRESMVSLDSRRGQYTSAETYGSSYSPHTTPPTPSWTGSWSNQYGSGYSPVGDSNEQPFRSGSKKVGRKKSLVAHLKRSAPQTIDEEEYDLSLLGSAAPMGSAAVQHDTIHEEQGAVFDLTASLGPMSPHDEAFVQMLQKQEAQGQLTGGIGEGFKPEVVVRDTELLPQTTTAQRSFSQSFSSRMSRMTSRRLGRSESIKAAGQDRANKRGEVIQVIMEEDGAGDGDGDGAVAGADLSSMEGPIGIAPVDSRRSTLYDQNGQTRVFYPQPNWKPFPMCWPWLMMLVFLSVGLAAMQEVLYQKYNKSNPLVSFDSPEKVPGWLYIMIKFGPTLIAVIYGVLWQFTDFEVRRLEAYYQMSKPEGALAAESINVDYVTSFSFWRPFRALKVGHYAVALSSVSATFAASLVPTFASASLVLTPDRRERMAHPEAEKIIAFSPVWSRLLTSVLGVCAVGACTLFYILQRRRSGLSADVQGIAGLASMAVVSHILMDFKDMDTATPKDIHHKLKHHRYILRNSSLAPDVDNPPSSQERDKYRDIHLSNNPHPLSLRPAGGVPFIIGLLLFMGFVPAFLFSAADIVTDKAPWAVTALAVCLKLSWNAMDTAVRMMEPYYILSRRHAHPKTLTLDYTALPFGYLPLRALFNGHLLMFFVGSGSVMAEFLTVLVTGLATVDGKGFLYGMMTSGREEAVKSGLETIRSFYFLFGLTMFTLLYMTIVATIVFVRRRHPFLPRQPNTIASTLAFIHQSKMLYTFVGTSKFSAAQMAKKLDTDVTYGLGWFIGRDGQTHCGVDQEELLTNYKHGVDVSKRNEPWNTQWDVL